MILINSTSAFFRKERFSPLGKGRRAGGKNKLVKESWIPGRVKRLEKSIVARIVQHPGFGFSSGGEGLGFCFIASFTSEDRKARNWRLTRPKIMERLVTFCAKEIKSTATEEREREEHSSAERQFESMWCSKAITTSFLKIKKGKGLLEWQGEE